MKSIMKVSESYGLSFAHNITIMPGLKTVRILGTRTKSRKKVVYGRAPRNVLDNPSVVNEIRYTKEVLHSQINLLKTDIDGATTLLKWTVSAMNRLYEENKRLEVNLAHLV
jgi:hypothetical protein